MEERLEVFRIKRKRDQDPLQGLILENNGKGLKRSRPNSFFFKLARTDNEENVDDKPILVIDEAKKLTLVPRRASITQPVAQSAKAEPELSEDILSMIAEQQSNGAVTQQAPLKHKKPVRKLHHKAEPIDSYNSSSDYVYDIYFRSVIDEASRDEQLRIAHFTYDEDIFNFVNEEPLDVDNTEVQDDEDIDSNAEDYYQNDYPEDEDNDNNEYLDAYEQRHLNEVADNTGDLVMSDDEDDNFEIQHNKRRFSTKDYQTYKDGGVLDTERAMAMTNDLTQDGFENLYNDVFNSDDEDYEGPTSFLDDGRVSDDNEEQFKRNFFFKGDEDDQMAIHRDKIFGRLEKMVNQNK